MKVIAALPVLIAFLVGALPAHAWTWPVEGPVLRPFHLGSDPYAAGQHRGVDVGAPAGAAVRTPESGLVSYAGTVPRNGKTLTIQTAGGYAVTLVHLGTIDAVRGASVEEGEAVGTIGPSGEPEHAVGYVHLGVRLASDPHGYVDPLTLLPALPATGGPAGGSGSEEPTAPPAEQGHVPDPTGTGGPPAEPADGESEPEAPAEPQAPAEPAPAEAAPDQAPEVEPAPSPSAEAPASAAEDRAEAGRPEETPGEALRVPPATAPVRLLVSAAERLREPKRIVPAEASGRDDWVTHVTGARPVTAALGEPHEQRPISRASEGLDASAAAAWAAAVMLAALAAVFASGRLSRRFAHPAASASAPEPPAAEEANAVTLALRADEIATTPLDAWLEAVLSSTPRCAAGMGRAELRPRVDACRPARRRPRRTPRRVGATPRRLPERLIPSRGEPEPVECSARAG